MAPIEIDGLPNLKMGGSFHGYGSKFQTRPRFILLIIGIYIYIYKDVYAFTCIVYSNPGVEYKHTHIYIYICMVSATIKERKNTLTLNLLLIFLSFYNSCLCSIIVFSPIFLTFTNSVG